MNKNQVDETFPTGLVYNENEHLLTLLQQSQHQSKVLIDQTLRQSSYWKVSLFFIFLLIGFIVAGVIIVVNKISQEPRSAELTRELDYFKKETSIDLDNIMARINNSSSQPEDKEFQKTLAKSLLDAKNHLRSLEKSYKKQTAELEITYKKQKLEIEQKLQNLENTVRRLNKDLTTAEKDLILSQGQNQEITDKNKKLQEDIALKDALIKSLKNELAKGLGADDVRKLNNKKRED